MPKPCPDNERIKHAYFAYLREAKGRSEQTIDSVAKAIARFEQSTGYRDFKRFHIGQAIAFKRALAGERNARTGKPLSLSTARATIGALNAFFLWLADQEGYRSKIRYTDAAYFGLSENEARAAQGAVE